VGGREDERERTKEKEREVTFTGSVECERSLSLLFRLCSAWHSRWALYRVAKTHRIPYLHRSFSAKVTYIWWLFCEK